MGEKGGENEDPQEPLSDSREGKTSAHLPTSLAMRKRGKGEIFYGFLKKKKKLYARTGEERGLALFSWWQ